MVVAYETSRAIKAIPLTDIFVDETFNARKNITPHSCMELADDIRRNKLQSPVIVRPHHGEKPFTLIAGHRRFMAHKINKAATIDAEIREGLTEKEARVINLIENVGRLDLTFMEEAHAYDGLSQMGMSPREIATTLSVAPQRVEVRLAALTLEPAIQQDIALGLLTQPQIKALAEMPPGEDRFEAVKNLKTAKMRGDKKPVQLTKKVKPQNVHQMKQRKQDEIYTLQDHIIDAFGTDGTAKGMPEKARLIVKSLGWVIGAASTMEIYEALRGIAEEEGIEYSLPEEALLFIRGA